MNLSIYSMILLPLVVPNFGKKNKVKEHEYFFGDNLTKYKKLYDNYITRM